MTRVIFLGTPAFSVPSLEALAAHPGLTTVGVVTQPDRPAGRGLQMQVSAVKQVALRLGLPVFQPETLRDEAAIAHLRDWEPDVLVTAAFGQILRRPVLEMAPFGSLNVHASLLPRWRGAAPIQYAIRAGDQETGITIMKMEVGLDTGPMLRQRAIPILPGDTGGSLHDKLAVLGADLLIEALIPYLDGTLTPEPQPEGGVTLAPTLSKEEGAIDWERPATEIDRLVRAFDPWPGTYTFLNGERLKVIQGIPRPALALGLAAGTLAAHESGLVVQTGTGCYEIARLQPGGKRIMDAAAFLAGYGSALGARLG